MTTQDWEWNQIMLMLDSIRLKSGTIDEIKLRQLCHVPDLKKGDKTQHAFMYTNDEDDSRETYEWRRGKVIKDSNDNNHRNTNNGTKCYAKGIDV